jgi:arsenate reductase
MSTVVFACLHNAGRSQMAAAFFNQLVDSSQATATSAGTQPAIQVHPEVLAAMKEVGIDLSGVKPQLLTAELASGTRFLVTMGCGEACPFVPGAKIVDWDIEDPKGKPVERVRQIRDDIQNRVAKFAAGNGWSRTKG